MGKISHCNLEICRERCEFASELRLHTEKQYPPLSALEAAILSCENSYSNFTVFIYMKNKELLPYEMLSKLTHVLVTQQLWRKARMVLSFIFLPAASLWRKTLIPHRGTENLGELICMFSWTPKAENHTWESSCPHATPYWEKPTSLQNNIQIRPQVCLVKNGLFFLAVASRKCLRKEKEDPRKYNEVLLSFW